MASRRMRTLLSPYIGLAGFLVSAAWEAFWLVGPPVGVNAASRDQYLFWGLIAIVVSCCQMFVRQRAQIRDYEQRFEPKAELTFDPRDVNHVQNGTVVRAVNYARIPCDEYLYAIGVVNLSSKPIAGCRLVLESSKPHDTSQQRLGRAIRVRDDPERESDGVFTLNPRDGIQPSTYVEVLREVVPKTDLTKPADIQLRYANSVYGQPNWFTDRNGHVLTFQLEGDMARSVRLRLAVRYDDTRRRWSVERVDKPIPSA